MADDQLSHFLGFRENELELFPIDLQPIIHPDFIKSLAHNLLFDRVNRIWRPQSSDGYGRTLTSPGVGNEASVAARIVALTSVESVLSDVRTQRQFIYIQNVLPTQIVLGLKAGDTATAPILIPNDYTMLIQGYTGKIFAASPTVAGNIYVIEG